MPVLDKFRLNGKIALITGGASGLGLAFAQAVLEAGANVAIVDQNKEMLEKASAQLSGITAGKIITFHGDVTNEDEIESIVLNTVEQLGGLDICFANAGISGNETSIMEYDKKTWDQVIAVNLTGVFLTNRAVSRFMIKTKGGGSIINTASIYGLVGDYSGRSVAYTASKGGVIQLTKTFAAQLAPYGVRVNAIAPGFVRTNLGNGALMKDIQDSKIKLMHEQIVGRTLLGRFAEPEDLQGIGLFLASDASSYCTGYTYAVDGGWLSQ